MSVVIIGGNECMERKYKELCREYGHTAKVYTKLNGRMRGVGNPDLMILFTGTMSHKMLYSVMSETKGKGIRIEKCSASSSSALKSVLDRIICT